MLLTANSIAIAGDSCPSKAAKQMASKASDGWSTSCSMRVIRSGGNQGKKGKVTKASKGMHTINRHGQETMGKVGCQTSLISGYSPTEQ